MAVDLTTEQKLPHNLDAERSVLGAILLDNQAFHPAIEVLEAGDFFLDSHRRLFGRITHLAEQNRPIDLITLHEELERSDELEAVGGSAYLSSLVDGVPRVSNIEHYARIVKEKALLRNLINASSNIINQALEAEEEADEVLDRAEHAIFALAEERIRAGLLSLHEIAKATIPRLDELFERRHHITGLATGFTDLDNITSGLQPADLVILAARPGVGKTALALNIMQHAALQLVKPAAIFSMEMAREALLYRLLCAEARVDSHRFRSGFLNREEMGKLTQALARLAEAPIWIDDTPALTVLEMRAKCRRLQAEKGLALVVVDYLQLMSGRGRYENRTQEISSISRGLKALAKELRLPVIAVSQLSRAPEQRGGDHRPQLSDLRESGSIEQDADVVAFIFRPEMYRDPDNVPDDERGLAELLIAKQRNGPTGKVKLAFLREFTRFENLLRQAPAED
ncbi:MAG: replicative DNA helicase [Candidatus Acidiferrales bacterium]